jgi:hypothetical protein
MGDDEVVGKASGMASLSLTFLDQSISTNPQISHSSQR